MIMETPKLLVIATLAACIAISTFATDAAKQCKTINFFLHDNLLTLTDASAYVISLPQPQFLNPLAGSNQSFFGTLVVFDDSMTLQPSPQSTEIGRGRGTYVFDANDKKGPAIQFTWTAEFNSASGYSAGSTMCFQGFDRTTDLTREIAIVGGTKDFRHATGWAQIVTYSLVGAAAVLNITAEVCYGC